MLLSTNRITYLDPVPSDIEVSQSVTPFPIQKVAENALLFPEDVELHGPYMAKVLAAKVLARPQRKNQQQGGYVVVTGITPTPLGEGKSTTTIGLCQGIAKLDRRTFTCIRQPSQGPTFGVKGGAAGGGYAQVVPMELFNLHMTGDIHAIGAANNLLAAAIDTRIFHEDTQTDVQLFDRLCPKDIKTGKRSYAPIMLGRLSRLGITDPDKLQDPDQLTNEERSRFVRLDIDRDTITWKRVVDVCDRHLRGITIGQAATEVEKSKPRNTAFEITVASEIMAVLALCQDLNDLRVRLGRMVVALSKDGASPITADDLGVGGALAVLMRDAINPTLMQNIEGGPVLVHAGPFANIAHGNSSVLADAVALRLCGPRGVVVTEAGFGADVGGEKFFDIKTRVSGLFPDCAVIVATVRALKTHGGGPEIKPGAPLHAVYKEEHIELLSKGCANLARHIDNLKKFKVKVIVAINKFATDTDAEIATVKRLADEAGADAAVLANHWALGGAGALDLAKAVVTLCDESRKIRCTGGLLSPHFLYPLTEPLKAKIECVAREIYRASTVEYSALAEKQLDNYERLGWGKMPVCIAKTQYSISTDPTLKGAPEGHTVKVREARASIGAGFVFVLTGDVMTIPGLSTKPGFYDVDLDTVTGRVIGLF